jgi:hypothetical protein
LSIEIGGTTLPSHASIRFRRGIRAGDACKVIKNLTQKLLPEKKNID